MKQSVNLLLPKDVIEILDIVNLDHQDCLFDKIRNLGVTPDKLLPKEVKGTLTDRYCDLFITLVKDEILILKDKPTKKKYVFFGKSEEVSDFKAIKDAFDYKAWGNEKVLKESISSLIKISPQKSKKIFIEGVIDEKGTLPEIILDKIIKSLVAEQKQKFESVVSKY